MDFQRKRFYVCGVESFIFDVKVILKHPPCSCAIPAEFLWFLHLLSDQPSEWLRLERHLKWVPLFARVE